MRRIKQLLPHTLTEEVLRKCTSGVLALIGDDDYPYTVPLSYVYDNGALYFHSALNGHKIDALQANIKASFCVVEQDLVIPNKLTTHYRSAVAFGKLSVLDGEEKLNALYLLSNRYSSDFPEHVKNEIDKLVDRVHIIKLTIEHLTGKASIELVND